MKWTTAILPLGLIARNVRAAPLDGLDLFKLKLSSSSTELNGNYISTQAAGLGVHAGDGHSPVRVYLANSQKQGLRELHTYPIGIVDHGIGLVGSDGFFALKDIVNPVGSNPPDGKVYQWDTFQVSDGKLTNDGAGSWLAFPGADGGWTVSWSDGTAFLTQDYMPVEILLEKTGNAVKPGKAVSDGGC